MRYKLKRKCSRMLSAFLIVMVLFSYCDFTALAGISDFISSKGDKQNAETSWDKGNVKTSPSGSTAYGEGTEGSEQVYVGANDPNCNAITTMGVLVKLVAFNNTVKGDTASQTALANHNASVTPTNGKTVLDEIQFAVVDKYLYDWPEQLYGNARETFRGAFIRTYDNVYGYGVDTGLCCYRDCYGVISEFMPMNSELVGYPGFNSASDAHASGAYYAVSTLVQPDHINNWCPVTVVSDMLRNTDGGWQTFITGNLDYETARAMYNANTLHYRANAVAEFTELFRNTALLTTMLSGIWTQINSSIYYDFNGNLCLSGDMYKGYLLDMYMTIDYMAGQGTFKNEIEVFLDNLNNNGSSMFVVPVIAQLNGNRVVGTPNTMFSTLPDYYGYCYNAAALGYTICMPLTRVNALNQLLTESNSGRTNNELSDWYEAYKNVAYPKDPTVSNYTFKYAEDWWSQSVSPTNHNIKYRNQANRFKTTDLFGKTSGQIGYTYLALGGGGTEVTEVAPNGGFYLNVDSSVSVVAKGSTVAANVTTDLAQEDVTIIQNAYTKNGSTAKLELAYSLQNSTGTGTSTTLMDNLVSVPTGMTKSGNNLVWNNVDYATLLPYIDGTKQVKWIDSGITINDSTQNTYKCVATLSWSNGEKIQLEAGGKKIESTYMASDTVMWTASEPDMSAWYYSEIRDKNFAEVKHNSPGQEGYEAMAGIPTTENLYVGFGATEFMVNMDVNFETSNGTRTYTYVYDVANCYGHDDKCVYTCNGHTENTYAGGCGKLTCTDNEHSHGSSCYSSTGALKCTDNEHTHGGSCYCDSGTSESWNCSSGEKTIKSKCECGAKEKETEIKPSYGAGYTECIGGDGTVDYTGKGCVVTHKWNSSHPGATFTGTITQKIEDFNYLDIAALDLWRLSKVEYKGNSSLFKTANGSTDPNLGYYSFYSQEGFSNADNPMTNLPGNGRLVFFVKENQVENNVNIYGNTTTVCDSPTGEFLSWEDANAKALEWMNNLIDSESVACRVVSDYLILETSEGYQSVCYDEYWSDTVKLTNETFKTTSFTDGVRNSLEEIGANNITFSTPRTFEQAWLNNTDTASSWEVGHITRSGYNGHYESPSSKWSNNNATSSTNYVLGNSKVASKGLHADTIGLYVLAEVLDTVHPNSRNRQGSRTFATGFNNQRLTLKGFDIIDSMDTTTKLWDPDDGITPVYNGAWDTGHAYVTCTKDIDYEDTYGGIDWGAYGDGTNYKQEVGYTWGKSEINDIVVHNPTTTQYCTVICNDANQDQRTAASLAAGGDPAINVTGCPKNESCAYQTLICTEQPSVHSASCYTQVNTTKQCVGGYNSHVCTAECYEGCKLITNPDSENKLTLPAGWYYIEVNGAAGLNGSGTVNQNGSTIKGYFNLTTTSTFTASVGEIQGTGKAGEATTFYINGVARGTAYGGNGSSTSRPNSSIYITDGVEAATSLACTGNGFIKLFSATEKAHVHVDSCYTQHVHSEAAGCYENQKKQVGSLKQTYDPVWGYSCGNGHCAGKCSYCGGHWGYCSGSHEVPVLVCTKSTNKTLVCTEPAFMYSKSPLVYLKNGVEATAGCTGAMNKHTCTDLCKETPEKVLVCENPHHYALGDPVPQVSNGQIIDNKYHYTYGDARCWEPCCDDSKHKPVEQVQLGDGEIMQTSDIFINLGDEFWVYFPNNGDFAQQPDMLGILETTNTLGKGYYNNMDCNKWTRDKVVYFPFAVTMPDCGHTFPANYPICLYYHPGYTITKADGTVDGTYYNFKCLTANSEMSNAEVKFVSIASNAKEILYDESVDVTNKQRVDNPNKARHTANKKQFIDIVGYIGNLTINDTGDFRFATLFKQAKNDGTWLIENLIPNVYLNLPNKIASDPIDILGNIADASTNYHSTFGVTYSSAGGKAYDFVNLPLTPVDNPIEALSNQPMRPGYQLYMDVETIGNYYGENRNGDGVSQDTNLYYKTQITPRYWALELDSGDYYPVDVYAGKNGEYTPVVFFDGEVDSVYNYYYYLDWLEESTRRNFTSAEKNNTLDAAAWLDTVKGRGSGETATRYPTAAKDVIGTAETLHLNDLNRTFIGSQYIYGELQDGWEYLIEDRYYIQSQRWHFTLGLPSSTVFVKAGKACTDASIKEIQDMNAVILCSIDIKARGEVWTLEYDGTAINYSDGGGFKVYEGGSVYAPPIDPETGEVLNDPIIAAYSNKFTSADDLRTEGSH